jgi:hypothetical protein
MFSDTTTIVHQIVRAWSSVIYRHLLVIYSSSQSIRLSKLEEETEDVSKRSQFELDGLLLRAAERGGKLPRLELELDK